MSGFEDSQNVSEDDPPIHEQEVNEQEQWEDNVDGEKENGEEKQEIVKKDSHEEEFNIYSGNEDYNTILQTLSSLQFQLEQARRDIQVLYDLRKNTLSEPETFLDMLENGGIEFPRMQNLCLLPHLSFSEYRQKHNRRSSSRYDQNLGYLLQRVDELQRREGGAGLATAEASLLLSTPLPTSFTPGPIFNPEDEENGRNSVRQRFREIAGVYGLPMRAASAPALIISKNMASSTLACISEHNYSKNEAVGRTQSIPNRSDIFSPQPQRANSVQFSVPFLPGVDPSRASSPAVNSNTQSSSPLTSKAPSSLDSSRSSSSLAGGGGEKKKKMKISPLDSSHHNLPWTEKEKRRLDELMDIYPEEEVMARRYAKISAAIGTRTPGQVANRINKLMQKKKKRSRLEFDSLTDTSTAIEDVLDDQLLQSAEYQEYILLRKQIEALEADPDLPVHVGFKCDDCGVEPIVGDRWRCTKCREPNAIDLCQECYDCAEYQTTQHRPNHKFLRQTI